MRGGLSGQTISQSTAEKPSEYSGVSRRSFVSLVFLLLAWLMLSTAYASAQLSSATLNGVSGIPPGCCDQNGSVVLRNLGTSVERITASNDTGNYVSAM